MIESIPWYMWAIFSAIAASLMDIFSKKSLEKVHVMEFRTTFKTFQIPMLIILLPFVNFHLSLWIYFVIFIIAVIAVVAGVFYCKAIRHSEISSVAPMKNISPVFLLILSYFLLGEVVTLQQGIGILVLIIGTYILEVDHSIANLKGPFVKIMKSQAIHYVLFALFLYSLSAIGDKYILGYTDSFTFLFLIWGFMIILYNIISILFYGGYKDIKYCTKKAGGTIFLVSLFSFISALTYLQALTMAMVTLVIPIKRLSTLFSTIVGGELFHEHGLKLKAGACVILIIGSLLIVL